MSVTITKDTVSNVVRSIEALTRKHVLVGIPAAKAPRRGEPITNAALGYLHEHGSPAQHIPPRPFLVPGVRASTPEVERVFRQTAIDNMTATARVDGLVKGLTAAGLVAQASVKNTIVAGAVFAPLQPSTLAARRRKGAKGEKPLIRTGQLLNSITFAVRDR